MAKDDLFEELVPDDDDETSFGSDDTDFQETLASDSTAGTPKDSDGGVDDDTEAETLIGKKGDDNYDSDFRETYAGEPVRVPDRGPDPANETTPEDAETFMGDGPAETRASDSDLDATLDTPSPASGSLVPPPVSSGALRPTKPSNTRSPDKKKPVKPPLPKAIGKYRILKELGQGGMGSVYLAEQEQPRRKVALKVIRAGLVNEQLLRRFDAEAQLLGRLSHPGIGLIYEAGTAITEAGETPYFAMEFIDGVTLGQHIKDNKLGTRARLELFSKVCDAVQHAHAKGIIHRDLKPANIMVDRTGQPKILDFGVARATDSDVQTATQQTDVGQLIGTEPYMSPEQVTADPGDLDTRSDVYALGVIMYELLAGKLPYDLRKKMLHDAVRIIREDEPTRLSAINKVFRGDVETIVQKSLEKGKERRYQSANDLAADIRRYLSDEPIQARPPSTKYQLQKFAKRNKALVAGAAGVFVALVVGLIASTTFMVRAMAAERQAEANFVEAETQRQLAQENLSEAETQRARAESSLAEAERQRVLAEENFVEAETQRERALQSFEQAESERVRAVAAEQRASQRFTQVRTLARTFIFDFHDQIQNLPGSIPARELLVSTASGYLDNLVNDAGDDPTLQIDIAAAYRKVGDVQGLPGQPNLGDTAGAMVSYTRSLALLDALPEGVGDPAALSFERATVLNRIGDIHAVTGRPDLALERHREALGLREALARRAGSERLSLAVTESLLAVGRDLAALGDIEAAAIETQRAVGVRAQIASGDAASPSTRRALALGHQQLAEIYIRTRDFERALGALREARQIDADSLRDDAANASARHGLARTYILIGDANIALGRFTDAGDVYTFARTISVDLARRDPDDQLARAGLASADLAIGRMRAIKGEVPGALAAFRSAASEADSLLAADPANLPIRNAASRAHESIGDMLGRLGERDDALVAYVAARDLIAPIHAADANNRDAARRLAIATSKVGQTRDALGDAASALAELTAAHGLATALADVPGATGADLRLAATCDYLLAALHGRLASVATDPGVAAEQSAASRGFLIACAERFAALRDAGLLDAADADLPERLMEQAQGDPDAEAPDGTPSASAGG